MYLSTQKKQNSIVWESGRELKLVVCWSPYPFADFARCRDLYLDMIHAYPHVILADCRAGHSQKTDRLLRQADLILLFLPHAKDLLRGLFQEAVLYQRACLPILCGYQRFAEPTPEQIRVLYRLGDCPVGLLPDREEAARLPACDGDAFVRSTGRLIRRRIEAL